MKRILLIEDDAGIREGIGDLLTLEGYRVDRAANGEEGLALLRRPDRPALVIVDLVMPVMNGVQFLERFHQDPRLAGIPAQTDPESTTVPSSTTAPAAMMELLWMTAPSMMMAPIAEPLFALAEGLFGTTFLDDPFQVFRNRGKECPLLLQERSFAAVGPLLEIANLEHADMSAPHPDFLPQYPSGLPEVPCPVLPSVQGETRTGDIGILPGGRNDAYRGGEDLLQGEVRLLCQTGDRIQAVELFHPLAQLMGERMTIAVRGRP